MIKNKKLGVLSKNRKVRNNLKKFISAFLLFLLGALIGIIIYQLFTIETTYNTPAGNYTCRGEIIEICSGSNEVADYLGV